MKLFPLLGTDCLHYVNEKLGVGQSEAAVN